MLTLNASAVTERSEFKVKIRFLRAYSSGGCGSKNANLTLKIKKVLRLRKFGLVVKQIPTPDLIALFGAKTFRAAWPGLKI
jgi:hypothetical protein